MIPARTRFAPSPTGFMHVGGVRTALFAWLIARQSGGQFILRIEDTDQVREVSGSQDHIISTLNTLGLHYDEGPAIGGPYAPYRQSERLPIYQEWGQKLVDKGRAYADPYTAEQLEQFRAQARVEKRPFLYRDHRPIDPPAWDGSQALRFRSHPQAYQWQDEVMGPLSAGAEAIDDYILLKSDGFPTYNFGHVIDDYLMKCTHVIRSQEFLASIPRFLNLYDALEIDRPKLATLPVVLGPDGKKKLSKRDGAKDILDYIRQGYLPETLVNFLASLGWNDGTEQELFSAAELVQKFSLARVQRSGAKFDEQRLLWMNGAHIRALSLDDLFTRAVNFWPPEASNYDENYKRQVLALLQDRLKYLSELRELSLLFFVDLPLDPTLITGHKQLAKLSPDELRNLLQSSLTTLEASDFSLDDLQQRLNHLLESLQQKPALLFSLIRIAATQAPASPGLAESLVVLGKARVLTRIGHQLENL